MPTLLEQSIFRILAYTKYTEFSLTTFEVWKWCDINAASILEIETCLNQSEWLRNNGVSGFSGFWAIGDVEEWRIERISRVTDALRKSRRARTFAAFAAWLPWVQMIAVCNSLAFSFTKETSDIDLFIVTRPGRLWSTRLVLTGVLALLRLRPGETIRDPICLSFFVDTNHLDLASLKIGSEDPYLQMWIASLSPIMDRDDVLIKLRAVNRWIRPLLPRSNRVQRALAYAVAGSRSLPDVGIFEPIAERIQRARFPIALRQLMNQDTRVVVTDGMLKFHENDRRQAVSDAWHAECQKAGI